ncbi:ATP-binding cassette domain-containing protein [Massilia atriviolacea]|uniref:ATP-binding cassette domain-containing protein n=1 Tax=Massilia atriviolacea TaxID=2495579 RepID=UPI00227739C6|nr:ATP-binding cassette domain-containing protein [Massilia atriviolacea]
MIKMPMSYQTKIGDFGDGLSGGQKQRLLLARAIFKKPKILILDEATSHLDCANETSVNEAIKALNIMRIVVAHRESTIVGSDRVFRLIDANLSEISASVTENDNEQG